MIVCLSYCQRRIGPFLRPYLSIGACWSFPSILQPIHGFMGIIPNSTARPPLELQLLAPVAYCANPPGKGGVVIAPAMLASALLTVAARVIAAGWSRCIGCPLITAGNCLFLSGGSAPMHPIIVGPSALFVRGASDPLPCSNPLFH